MQHRRQLNLLTALPAEAKPLIKCFALQRHQPVGAIPLYTTQGIHLAISGPGLKSIKPAISYLQAMTPKGSQPVWINLGICGHGSLATGELLLANQVTTPDGLHWKLQSPAGSIVNHGQLNCVASPQAVYQPQMAYDMESSGFLASLTPTTSLDRVHILKVVSDNPENGIETINAKRVNKLITDQISLIREFIEKVSEDG
ncbi:MAG: hypothetical protein N0C83_10575 [Candidatus Thiodiazotropha lotti]|nr:hypothetical protein [Candidatus Thiodiazotropha lotti]MCG8004311.1 hypothetical protein [Candidatus Thiodiazotropha lotti]MCW4187931.1 hypothetical protein [Candidatus Thiodiazotropha lotti]MCW4199736.1 hypothetical protein [Candidatus Thiodiazotropha lotti]